MRKQDQRRGGAGPQGAPPPPLTGVPGTPIGALGVPVRSPECASGGVRGFPDNQTLLEAIGNPRREAHDARRQAEYDARQREHQEELRRIAAQHKAEKEARRPVCADCGTRFTDERCKAIEPAGWSAPRETHPHLCDDCKQRAHAAERQAAQAVPEQKAGGTWLSRFRG
ncbi:hypothetical protein [Streptomyces sp. NPDC085529]|uniref:hypothetical protein n=1 Tax=Streptomyces sp. NPDC085529 TaxID=3365729 RepID=UPI0037D23EEE